MTELSENTKQVYRSKRNRVQKGIDTGFYSAEELPLAMKLVEELNKKLGETNDTIRPPGRPRGATTVRIPRTMMDASPEKLAEKIKDSEAELEVMKSLAEAKDPKWTPGTPEFEAREQRIRDRAKAAEGGEKGKATGT